MPNRIRELGLGSWNQQGVRNFFNIDKWVVEGGGGGKGGAGDCRKFNSWSGVEEILFDTLK